MRKKDGDGVIAQDQQEIDKKSRQAAAVTPPSNRVVNSNSVIAKNIDKVSQFLALKENIDYKQLWDHLSDIYQKIEHFTASDKVKLAEVLFTQFYCQDTFSMFQKSDMKDFTITQVLNSQRTIQNTQGTISVFQACYDLSIALMIDLCGGQSDSSNKENTPFNHDLGLHIINLFIKHQRSHLHSTQKACYLSLHALCVLFEALGEPLIMIAKERELLNFLFNSLPCLFKQESQSAIQATANALQAKTFNLNSLIAGSTQLFDQQQSNQPLETQLSQQAKKIAAASMHHQPPVSAKIPNKITSQDHSSKNLREERKRDKSSFINKLSFNRAISEPPSASKNNAVMPMPVTEDQDDEKQSSEGGEEIARNLRGKLEKVEEEENYQRMSNGKTEGHQRKTSSNRGAQVKAVPPLPMNQIQQMQQQIQTPTYNIQTAHLLQPHTTINSSSMVMTSYLNMPLGMFSTTLNHNHLSTNNRHPTGPTSAFQQFSQPNYKLNFVPSTTLAKSRLTRRQQSMSRKNTHKFSSVSNMTHGPYGGVNNDDGLGPVTGSIRHQEFSNERRNEYSSSQTRKGPQVPKLNINQINNAYDPTNQQQRNDMTSAHPFIQTGQALVLGGGGQLTNTNMLKSSNRSNAYSNQNFETHTVLVNQRLMNSQNPYQIRKQGARGDESEHNISLYEEVNGSFDEMGFVDAAGQTVIGGGDFNFENAEEKLKQLAIQLGEACLTNDLAALISQKRDLELVKTARKTNNLNYQSKQSSKQVSQQKFGQRSVSVNYSNEPFFKPESRFLVAKQDNKTGYNDTNNQQFQARLLLLNLSYKLLKHYDLDEIRFLKQPISALNSYLCSSRFKDLKKQQLFQALEEGKADVVTLSLRKYQGHNSTSQLSGLLNVDQTLRMVQKQNLKMDYNAKNAFQTISKSNIPLFEVQLSLEEDIVFKIYQKFTFVNEDILKHQVNNELANFASRERGLFGGALTYQSVLQQEAMTQQLGLTNQVPNLNLAPLGLGMTQQHNIVRQGSHAFLHNQNLSSDTSNSASSSVLSTFRDASTSISNPNIMWSSSGIGFDLSTVSSNSTTKSNVQILISKERLRRKLDVFLYNLNRRIKNHISVHFQQFSSLDKINYHFAKNLRNELITLNAYLESQKSRIMLFQLIEITLESLLTIKKCLTDLAVRTNIFVIDFSKNIYATSVTPDTMNMRSAMVRSPNSVTTNIKQQQKMAVMIKNQKMYRQFFAEFLRLISIMLSMIPDSVNQSTQETMKLFNELFISGDDQWQESVKTYVVSLFLSDLVSTIDLQATVQGVDTGHNQDMLFQQASFMIDDLRGINLVNFEEETFLAQFQQILSTDVALAKVKKSLYVSLTCASHSLLYFQSVMAFYHKCIAQHFSHRYGTQRPKQNVNSGNGGGGNAAEDNKDKNEQKIGGGVTGQLDGLRRNIQSDQQSSVHVANQEESHQVIQKYWKQAIRKILYQMLYLITPPNGLLSSYMSTNAINFLNFGAGSGTSRLNQTGRAGQSVSPLRPTPSNFFSSNLQPDTDQQSLLRYGSCPLNFQLTLSTLNFLRLVFNLPGKFTKYAFLQDELMLFYIRTHYISFVRLYNKNFSKTGASDSKQRSMSLCKEHLECLFAISRHRNEDTRRKLYQFKILQFMCQEIELEFECTTAANKQKRDRLMKEAKGGVEQEEIKKEETPQVKVQSPKENTQAIIKEEQPVIQQPQVKKMGFGIPKLNIKGLGLSEIIPQSEGAPVGNKTQIEIDQLRLLAEEQKKKAEKQKSSRRSSNSHRLKSNQISKVITQGEPENNLITQTLVEQKPEKVIKKGGLPFAIPKLKVEGLGLSEIIEPAKPVEQEVKIQNVIVKKHPGLSIPKLNVNGLGLSEIIPGTAAEIISQPKEEEGKFKDLDSSSSDEFDYSKDQIPQPLPQQQKSLGFAIPKLNVAGLGLSEIIPDKPDNTQSIQNDKAKSSNRQDEVKIVSAPQKKGLPFGIPKLNVAGLGLSEIVPGTGDPNPVIKQEEQPVPPPQQPEPPKKFTIPKLNVSGLGLSEIIPGTGDNLVEHKPDAEEQKNIDKNSAPVEQKQKKPMGFSIPKLNVTGLGLSEIVPGTGDPLPPSINEKVEQPKKPMPPAFNIPKLNVAGLGLSEIIPGTEGKPIVQQQNEVINEELKKDSQIPQFKKPLGFSIPKLNIVGLGLSELRPDTPKQNNDAIHIEEQKVEPPIQSKPKIGIPKLNITGLGLSELVPDDPPKQQDLVTINPNMMSNIQSVQQTIDYASGFIDPKNLVNNAQTTTNQGDMLFQQRQTERKGFENTAPVKIFDSQEEELKYTEVNGASAPQDNRKIKKQLVMPQTRNDFSVKESLESAQYIHFTNKLQPPQFNNDLNDNQRLFDRNENPAINLMRVSQQSQIKIESIMDGSNFSGSMIPSPMPEINKGIIHSAYPLPESVPFGSPENQMLPLNNQSQIPLQPAFFPPEKSQTPVPILKKPGLGSLVIPLIKIPEKNESEQGANKIQQQIEYSKQNEGAAGDLTKLQKELTKNNVKFQVLMENQKSQKCLLTVPEQQEEQAFESKNNYDDVEAYYLKERSMRPIYQDEELHVLMISMVVCLLLTPERGTLDDLYCSQFPIDNGKQNILFLLHHHLNHPQNSTQIIYKIMSRVHKEVSPPLAGVRLLKLLSSQLFDLGLYNNGKGWTKIAEGAYSQVYESKTNLAEPQLVAIKELFIPKSIYDRCVLHDIFTEITCLEELRLEPCVSDLYDYGLNGGSYYIIMKRYTCSLRQWRLNQTKTLNENLSLYLSIYKEFLKSLMIVHQHNVTHYDIKCDNVLLDFNTDGSGASSLSSQFLALGDNEDDKIKLTIGDFGECKVFSNEKDEFCQRNRGTDFCKSPEMLQLTINTRKDTEKYDRRKQVGTNRLSDVWSAGCLLYELLTGEYLFYTPDYLQFHFRVTRPSEALFTQERLDKINNNVYLIDFMKYMLVRDLRLRPSIENVLKRFEHVHALLVSTTGGGMNMGLSNMRNSLTGLHDGVIHRSSAAGGSMFEQSLEQAVQIMRSSAISQTEVKNRDPYYLRILDDISLCNLEWLKLHTNLTTSGGQYLVNQNITHLVLTSDNNLPLIRDSYTVLEVPDFYTFADGSKQKMTSFLLQPLLLDYLRSTALKRGRVLFVESETSQILIRESILLSLSHLFQTSAYETYTVVRSQNLQFNIFNENEGNRLSLISQFTQLNNKVLSYISSYPRFQCKCGSCTIILKRKYANYNNMETVSCTCSHYYRNVESSVCPSPGCTDFINYLKTHFKMPQVENLQWGFFEIDTTDVMQMGENEPIVVGPKNIGNLMLKHNKKVVPNKATQSLQRIFANNISQGIDVNCEIVSIIEKKNTANIMGVSAPHQRKNEAVAVNGLSLTKWKLYKCKECHVWTHAFNEADNRFAVLLNNRIKSKNHFINIRTLTAKQQDSAANVRVPILQKLKMSLPF